ncbi:MAG TPA: alkaline phosphatase family protein [Vicinamibacterales bacterium]
MRLPLSTLLLAALLASPVVPAVHAQEPPRLVVFISVDQFRSDYIDRYGDRWTGGLRRLVTEGARFVEAAYPYLNTVTCAGHATMSTGAFPATHGMVLNAWWDREAGREQPCTLDPSTTAIGYTTPSGKANGQSAALLRTHTFADELRGQARRPPRIVSLSMKPRSAIMLAGRRGDAVVWFESATGFTTSTAYTPAPVPFVEAFVKAHPLDKEHGEVWTRLLPESEYLYEDEGEGEKPSAGWTRSFPHPITVKREDGKSVSLWSSTPWADAYLGRMARAAVDELKMGQTEGTDYLAISFSVLDSIGHAFGPRSHEVQDVLLRLDRTIGELLQHLDAKVGADRYVVALTGDHGVAPLPEQAVALGLDAGRVNLNDVAAKVEALLTSRLGQGKYIARIAYTDLYFMPGVYDRLNAEPAVLREVLDAIREVPGIARVLESAHLMDPAASDDPVVRAARLNYFPERSGDLILVPKPYWLMSTSATTHGTFYGYDQHVPVVLYGSGIKPGRYWQKASPADIAPTLAALCGITLARTDGRVLAEALQSGPPPAQSRRTATP